MSTSRDTVRTQYELSISKGQTPVSTTKGFSKPKHVCLTVTISQPLADQLDGHKKNKENRDIIQINFFEPVLVSRTQKEKRDDKQKALHKTKPYRNNPQAYKELYGGGNSSGYNGKLVQGSQEDMPKGTQQVGCCFNNKKVSALNLDLPSESKPTDNYAVL
ncbi:hypothetical protein DUI87_07560 [Hirundo rustica rustica]|uniref:Uncharacterized protein n=1 Tax=Hirundo rustica rustica TaxID=333673 RepID=A0A3M0KQ19_HIRRU|nr:hypothetical protein DUI87_07560 [Hirundo rustica rustica]